MTAGKTRITIAHKISSVIDADNICVLQNGSIVEYGTHDALMEQRRLYRTMYEAQKNGE